MSLRTNLIRYANTLPKGSSERKMVVSLLKTSATHKSLALSSIKTLSGLQDKLQEVVEDLNAPAGDSIADTYGEVAKLVSKIQRNSDLKDLIKALEKI